jgi:single-stranded-DNA-specific exonuclease
MGEPGKATQLFLSETDEEIGTLVDHLFALDGRRKAMGETTWGLMLSQARECFESTGGRCVLVSDSRIQRGITGIMASRLQTFFKTPAIVISAGEEIAIGSIRSSRDGLIRFFFDRFSPFFTSFGGHDFAGGFNLPRSRLEEFLCEFHSRIAEIELVEKQEESIAIDAEIPVTYLSEDLHNVVELFEPYGEGNQPLAFLTRRMRIVSADLIGRKEQNHVKLLLEAGKLKWPAVFWNAAPRLSVDFAVGDTVDVVYRFGKNTYGGSETPQLTVLDVQR